MKLLLTCEHGGNIIPEEYSGYFTHCQELLQTHRGYDLGALDAFETLLPLADYSSYSEISRWLIELNRSLHHPKLFSADAQALQAEEKQHLIDTHYLAYRNPIEAQVREWLGEGEQVLHLSIHSFTPIMGGVRRNADIGLLYDSRRPMEKVFCQKLKSAIHKEDAALKTRYNYPYLGKADGFTTHLRRQFHEGYQGVEVEVNQRFSSNNQMDESLKKTLLEAIKHCLPA